jgi:hypothetical protein
LIYLFQQRSVLQKAIYLFHPWFSEILDVLGQPAVPQTRLPVPQLDHVASSEKLSSPRPRSTF